MILSIFAYGQPVLKQVAAPIQNNHEGLSKLISDMWETMYDAKGVGLAAPQIGQALRLFVVDTIQIMEEGEEAKGIKKVFINATILEETGKKWDYEEGCLSIPKVRADVSRHANLKIRYMDEHFNTHEEEYDGINARVIQHEYDHIEGILFVELLSPLKKNLLLRRLDKIRKGEVSADYRMKFYVPKKVK